MKARRPVKPKRRAPRRSSRRSSSRVSRADFAFLLDGNRRGLTVLTALAVVSAASEAFFLTALVQGAAALGSGRDSVTVGAGAVQTTVAVPTFLAAALVAALVRSIFTAWSAVLGPRVTARSRERHRRNLLEAYLFSTWNAQAADRTGRLQQVFSTTINEVNAIVLTVTNAMTALVTLIVLLVVALVLSPPVTAALLASGVVIFLALRSLALESRRAARVDSEGRLASASHVSVVSSAGAEIVVLGASGTVAELGRQRIAVAEHAFARSNGLRQLATTSLQSLAFVVAAAGLVVVSVFDLPVDFATIGTIALLLLRAAGQANQVQQALGLIGQMSPFVSQVREMTAHFQTNQQRWGSEEFPEQFDLDLHGVEYAYPNTPRSVLHIEQLSIPQGSAAAVLGPSGSGKSTLIQLLLRLRPPSRGRVEIGGVDVQSLDTRAFTREITFVPQSPHLIPGTIRENIRFFREFVTDQQIETCARMAHIHDEIMRMPSGYDTQLDSHVDMLSGGQKQRISLARALATDPSILVLDEPTSALDPANEALVTDTLAQMKGQRTVVIITHRESTVTHCDMVLRLNRGRLELDRHRAPASAVPNHHPEAPQQ